MVSSTRLVSLLWLFICLSFSVRAQDFSVKSKYEYDPLELAQADTLISKQDFAAAVKALDGVIEQATALKKNRLLILALERKAYAQRRSGYQKEAFITIKEAIANVKRFLDPSDLLVSKVYYRAGSILHRSYEYADARSFLDTAQLVYNQSNSYDSALYKHIIDNKYYAYSYTNGSQDTLIKYLDIRLTIARNEKPYFASEELYILQDYPDLYKSIGDFEQALFYGIRAYKFAVENLIENPEQDIVTEIINTRTLAFTTLKLADVLYSKKEFEKSLELALQIISMIDKYHPANFPNYYAYYQLVGVNYVSLGQYEKALPYLERAAEINVKNSENGVFYAFTLVNMGNCYFQMGEEVLGLEYFRKSIAALNKFMNPPSPDFYSAYDNIGNYYFSKSEYKQALINYDSALRNNLNSYDLEVLDFPEGLNFSYKDFEALRKKTSSLTNAEIDSLSKDEVLSIAKDFAFKTHELLFERRNAFLATEGKLFLSQEFKSLYESAIESCYQMWKLTGDKKHFYDALQFSRYSKAILFLEQSEELELVNSNLLDQSLKQEFYLAKSELDSLEGSFYSLMDNDITSDSLSIINDLVNEARHDFQTAVDSIRLYLGQFDNASSSVFAELDQSISTRKVDKGDGVIEYFYGEEAIYAFGQDNQNQSFVKIDQVDSVELGLLHLVSSISQPPEIESFDVKLNTFKEQASYVYKTLLKPVLESFSDNTNHLVIIPDDYLSRLPFEVLVTSNEKGTSFSTLDYLIKDYSIQYELSNALVNNHNYKNGLDDKASGLLGISYKASEVANNRSAYGALPGTEREINHLKASVEGTYLLGGTKAEFLENARNYDVLHLAIHGEADTVNKYQSSLIFSGTVDNQLQTSDLYLAGLNARLAILSACESGVGTINRGEGAFSIARGFSLVGVPSIVMSLWKVNDKITSGLMVDMHSKFYKDGLSINESLRNAKLDYLKNSDTYTGHPYYWSAFIQLGDNIESSKNNYSKYQYIVVFGTLLLILAIAVMYKKRRRTK